jgi:sugar phosphate isomerase/epimerase
MEKIKVSSNLHSGLGLATNSYKKILKSGEITLGELIAWAAGRGFSWLEIRDADVTMTTQELLDLKELADKFHVRLHYAWDNEDLFYKPVTFLKGIKNATLFGKGTCCRVLLAPNTLSGKKGYTRGEMETLIPIINFYVKKAEEQHVLLCFENAMEPLKGDGKSYFGMADLLKQCPNMCVTFDAANAYSNTTCINPTEEELLQYYEQFNERNFYFHLKLTKNHEVLDSLQRNGDFNVFRLFKAFERNPNMLICLELPQQNTFEKMQKAVEESLQFIEGGNE